MKPYDAGDIRNVLLIGHSGSGKTTLLESMLHASGATTRRGSIEDGTTVSDHEPEEIERGVSLSLGVAPIEWGGCKINVLDAPGSPDFIGEVRSAIRAADAVLIVVSAVDGVQVQTEVAWELAVEAGLPRAIFVNKLDRDRASFARTLDQLVAAFGTKVAPIELPIGEEHAFEGIADLLHRHAHRYADGAVVEGEWPEDIAVAAAAALDRLEESVAMNDDALIEAYLEKGDLPEATVVAGVRIGFARAQIAPVLVGSAARSIGVDRVLQFIVEEFPSPLDREPIPVTTAAGAQEPRAASPGGPLTAFVFKSVSDPFVGHVTLFRVFSGTLRSDAPAWNATKGLEERLGRLFALRGKEHLPVDAIPAGDIGAVAKLAHTTLGDTFSGKDAPVTLPAIEMPDPLLAIAVSPRSTGDDDKLGAALARIVEEDPTLRIERPEETHQTIVHGMGDSHLEVAVERLMRKFAVEVDVEPARVAYRETVRTSATGLGRHVKQSGGHGQYAICTLEVEPLPRGGGFAFVDRIVGGAVPNQFIGSIEKGVRRALASGFASGNPMVDVRVSLVDGKHHPVDSSDMAFQIAGSLAIKEAVDAAGVVLLEPVVDLEVTVPDGLTGDVMGDLNAKRARIAGVEGASAGRQRIRATVPEGEVARYAIDLRSITHGRGAFTRRFSHYDEMPPALAERIIAQAQASKASAPKR